MFQELMLLVGGAVLEWSKNKNILIVMKLVNMIEIVLIKK